MKYLVVDTATLIAADLNPKKMAEILLLVSHSWEDQVVSFRKRQIFEQIKVH
jgi:hypothetical protein